MEYKAGQRVRLIRTGELGKVVTGEKRTGLSFPEEEERIQILWDSNYDHTRWPLVAVIEPYFEEGDSLVP